jgi:hypothetical protein
VYIAELIQYSFFLSKIERSLPSTYFSDYIWEIRTARGDASTMVFLIGNNKIIAYLQNFIILILTVKGRPPIQCVLLFL